MPDDTTDDPRLSRPATYPLRGGNLQTFEKLAQVHNIAVETAIRVESIGKQLEEQARAAREDTLRVRNLEVTTAVVAATRTAERTTLNKVWNVASAIGGGILMFAYNYFTMKH
jgi:hypothetical protein